MFTDRVFPHRWQTRRPVGHERWARTAHVLYETAWADAWPHLDDWFKTNLRHIINISRLRC